MVTVILGHIEPFGRGKVAVTAEDVFLSLLLHLKGFREPRTRPVAFMLTGSGNRGGW